MSLRLARRVFLQWVGAPAAQAPATIIERFATLRIATALSIAIRSRPGPGRRMIGRGNYDIERGSTRTGADARNGAMPSV
ncbi:hypothetical protein, partial [Ensifer sp. Root954]|uniref:hypothetical protein n=1 Tax=Ensifer sp. Root954 TaxID=1736611 RepID=UPI0007126A60